MATKRLEERFAFGGGKVRRPGVDGFTGAYPVVEGVLLCGPTSANRRRYRREAFAGDRVKRYDNRPVFLNHGRGGESRDYQDKVATIENARHRADGMPVGDLAVNPRHPFAEAFLFDAEHKPGSCGMSHVAHCETTPGADGWDEVTELVEAESVDVVVGPATTKGLYESKGGGVFTFKHLAEWVTRHPKSTTKLITRAKKLAEDLDGMGMGDAPAMAAEPAADADPDATVMAGLKAAGHAAWDACLDGKMTLPELAAKLKDLLKDHCKYSGGADEPAEGGDEGKAAEGKRSKAPGFADLVAEAKACGLKDPTVADVTVLSEIPTAGGRKAYCESVLARLAESPTSGTRRPGAGPLPGKDGGTKPAAEQAAPPTDGKEFGRWVQE